MNEERERAHLARRLDGATVALGARLACVFGEDQRPQSFVLLINGTTPQGLTEHTVHMPPDMLAAVMADALYAMPELSVELADQVRARHEEQHEP